MSTATSIDEQLQSPSKELNPDETKPSGLAASFFVNVEKLEPNFTPFQLQPRGPTPPLQGPGNACRMPTPMSMSGPQHQQLSAQHSQIHSLSGPAAGPMNIGGMMSVNPGMPSMQGQVMPPHGAVPGLHYPGHGLPPLPPGHEREHLTSMPMSIQQIGPSMLHHHGLPMGIPSIASHQIPGPIPHGHPHHLHHPHGPLQMHRLPSIIGQPEYRIFELNKRLQQRGDESDSFWWETFVTDFFEDDATMIISVMLEDGPKRFTVGRTLIPRYFRSIFESGCGELYFNLRATRDSFHNPILTLDSDCANMVMNIVRPLPVTVVVEGRLSLDFTADELMRIRLWTFQIRTHRELIMRSLLTIQDPNLFEQISKNITRSGLTGPTLSFLRLCVILEPMQELMSRQKSYNLSPRDCLRATLFQRWQRMMAPQGQPPKPEPNRQANKRRKRKGSSANSEGGAGGSRASKRKQSPLPIPQPSLAQPGDVMIVGEPTLMGGDFGEDDERLITRLENTQYDAAAAAAAAAAVQQQQMVMIGGNGGGPLPPSFSGGGGGGGGRTGGGGSFPPGGFGPSPSSAPPQQQPLSSSSALGPMLSSPGGGAGPMPPMPSQSPGGGGSGMMYSHHSHPPYSAPNNFCSPGGQLHPPISATPPGQQQQQQQSQMALKQSPNVVSGMGPFSAGGGSHPNSVSGSVPPYMMGPGSSMMPTQPHGMPSSAPPTQTAHSRILSPTPTNSSNSAVFAPPSLPCPESNMGMSSQPPRSSSASSVLGSGVPTVKTESCQSPVVGAGSGFPMPLGGATEGMTPPPPLPPPPLSASSNTGMPPSNGLGGSMTPGSVNNNAVAFPPQKSPALNSPNGSFAASTPFQSPPLAAYASQSGAGGGGGGAFGQMSPSPMMPKPAHGPRTGSGPNSHPVLDGSGPSSVSRPDSRSETGRPTSAGPNGFLSLPPVSSDLTAAVPSKQISGAQSVSNGNMIMHDVDAGFGFLLVGGSGGTAAPPPPPVFSASLAHTTSENPGLDNPKIPEFLPLVDGFEEELAQQQQHSKTAPLLCDGLLTSGTQAVSSSSNSKPPLLAFIESQSSGGGGGSGETGEPPSLSADQQLLQNSSAPSGPPLSLQP
nr:unnamed protein product [Spirometra erinaceieuropaei]